MTHDATLALWDLDAILSDLATDVAHSHGLI
jgi:hypothetical protein